jgi:ribosomal protein S18 acetylase RimI-like enzyme
VHLELAGAERVDEVRELWLALHHHHHRVVGTVELVDDDEVSWQRRSARYRDRLRAERGFLVLATTDRELVGYAFVSVEDGPDDTFPLGSRYAEVYSLSVAERARDRGIGTALLDFVDRELAGRDIVDVKIAVMVGNEAARGFYERRGFAAAETVLWRFGADSD